MGNDYYPPGTFDLPGDKDELKTYVFQVNGEIEVEAYSESDAEMQLEENIREIIAEAVSNGSLEIR